MKKTHEIDLSRGRLLPKLIIFSVPVIFSGVLQLAFNAADLIVVGRFAGGNSLAAVGSNGALVALVVNVLVGIGSGVSVLVARYFGARDTKGLRDIVQTSLIMALLGGIIVGLLGIIVSKPLLKLLGTPGEVVDLAAVYLRIYFCGIPVIALYNFAGGILRAVGDTKRPLYYLGIAGVLNVLMNVFFVVVCGLDVIGVALATVLSQCVSCYLILRCLAKEDAAYRLELSHIRFSWIQCRQLLQIGLPAGIQGSLFSVANLVIQSSINSFGATVMAGASAGANIESFLFCVQDSLNQAAVASVSQNMGARQYERTKLAVLECTILQVGVSVALCILSMTFRRQLVSIYTTDPAAIEAGATRLLVTGVLYFMNGLQNMMAGTLRGHGYGLLPAVIALVGVCAFRILWIYTAFAWHPTLLVLYMSYPISWVITTAADYIVYFSVRNRAFAKNEAIYAKSPE